VAHAEASARTVDAAVTAAAAQLGLRADQVDFEVLEDPVPSTFGYIGTPARVRVTPRTGAKGPKLTEASNLPDSSDQQATTAMVPPGLATGWPSAPGGLGRSEPAVGPDVENGQAPGAAASTPESPIGLERPVASDRPDPLDRSVGSAPPDAPEDAEFSSASAAPPPVGTGLGSSLLAQDDPDATARSARVTDAADSALASVPTVTAPATPASASASPSVPEASAPSTQPSATRDRPPRRTYRDEPIEPQMVEEDTERAGDFLEGLLDALDVDGDITTWIDDAGGHIDLEGPDLDVLVGPNGEALDALQELTRLAVLRQSKRRVRLLIDINGFRARQRERLASVVREAAEQVIRTREDHELQPMTPAERKVVHDAVAAIDGVRTESLGEEPHRRVIIRPE
jgi:spoIIIJ-associated protein